MVKSSFLKTTLLVALGIDATGGLRAQTPPPPPTAETTNRLSRTENMGNTEVRKINQCSELIGTEVKNQQGEELGKIKDIVIDFTKNRIAYLVLETSKGTFSADRLDAVSLRAFQPSDDSKHLILNADKDKVANAEGFSKDNWPSPSNPTWEARPFWQGRGEEGRKPSLLLKPADKPWCGWQKAIAAERALGT
jgi:sporulation protein YlmC with PRC-barrel domain